MTGTALLALKQQLSSLSDTERREISAFLIKLGQDTPEWKKETARRLDEMAKGKKKGTGELRSELGHD